MGWISLLGRMAAGSAAVKCKSLMAPISVCDHVRLNTDRGGSTEKVTVNTTLLGGGFGRRGEIDFIVDAVETAKAVGAVPPPTGGRSGLSLGIDNLNFRLSKNAHGVWREEVGPNPVMMIDDLVRTEMRSVAHRVAVRNRNYFKAQRSG